jgi:hypothetical protein
MSSTRAISSACSGTFKDANWKERVDRGQPRVAGADAVAAFAFEMCEERGDLVCIEVFQPELGWLFAGLFVQEPEQQPEAVAIGGDRVRTGAPLPSQTLGEERLQKRRERSHERCSQVRSSRSAASANSCGAASKYQ